MWKSSALTIYIMEALVLLAAVPLLAQTTSEVRGASRFVLITMVPWKLSQMTASFPVTAFTQESHLVLFHLYLFTKAN
jgi:hypothetical protein